MEFAIGQVHVKISITNFAWGTRQVTIEANGRIAQGKIEAKLIIAEGAPNPVIASLVIGDKAHEEKSTS